MLFLLLTFRLDQYVCFGMPQVFRIVAGACLHNLELKLTETYILLSGRLESVVISLVKIAL